MFSRIFTKVFCADASSANQRGGANVPQPPSPLDTLKPDKDNSASSDDGRSGALSFSAGKRNVGTMEELHKKCKEVFPIPFEGAKLMYSKGLSNHFQVSHTLTMSTNPQQGNSGYRFGATYVGTKQLSPSEAFPVILGDIDPSGNLNANMIHQFSERVRVKFATQIQKSVMNGAQMTTDYKGDDFTASLTVANPNLINNSGIVVAHYLQAVTPKLDLGGELAYQYGSQVPGGKIAIMSAAGRYTHENSVWSATLGKTALHLCYYTKASEQLQFGVELETNLRMQESVATFGYQIDLPKADLVFKGMVDSNWTVGATLEKKLAPLPFTFAVSGVMNHTNNQFRLGCGLIIG